ncbi:MAG: PD-(D/E)XK nuclease family protein [Solirubrobacterales bacterium]
MALSLIVGPPNSGRAGRIHDALLASLDDDPVLIVPTGDDVARFERELADAAGEATGVLGVSIQTFRLIFEEVARATGALVPPLLSDAQRLCVVRSAARSTTLRALERSAEQPGFGAALARLIDEIQAAGRNPAEIAAAARGTTPRDAYLGEIAALYAAYEKRRDGLELGDDHLTAARATDALRSSPGTWRRPVFAYGFDDLTIEQLDLLEALAESVEVTVAVSYEDREALSARAGLYQQLLERGAERAEPELEPDPAHTLSPALYELERSFLADRARPVKPDDGLAFMESAGEHAQAEQIGAEVARLVASGVSPDQVAIVVRTPDRYGPLFDAVLAGYGIPAAVEASVPLAHTAAGRGLIALIRAALTSKRAEDLQAFVRAPGVAWPNDADWLERAIRTGGLRTVEEALDAWRGRDLFELDDLGAGDSAAGTLATLARLARRIAERPGERAAWVAGRPRRLELRAGALAAEALDSLAELPGIENPADEALAALDAIEVPLWRGPTDGHVRVTSPYRIRAQRVEHLFLASLQEGEFPRRDPGDAFLSDEQRAALGLPARAEADQEERYLLHVCLSRPTRRLHLCWRESDDDGGAAAPSPFLDDLAEVIEGSPLGGRDHAEIQPKRRPLGEVTFPIRDAPSLDELSRSLAASGAEAIPDGLELGAGASESIRIRLARAAGRVAAGKPGPLVVPAVVEELAERRLFGASTLEGYAVCSYRWFVGHELDPEQLDAEPEALTQGSAIHGVLEDLYREPPPGGPVPRPETLAAWRTRAGELVADRADAQGLGGDDVRAIASRARMIALIDTFLEREAAIETPLRPHPELLEAGFGDRDGDLRGPLKLDGFSLHGKIDRVDLSPSGDAGLIRDYKVSRQVTSGANLIKKGKLQPQLYALALEEQWKRRPLGGLYEPLAATSDHRPRGFASKDDADGLLAGLDLVGTDLLEEEGFRKAIDDARETAAGIVASMQAGTIKRDPIDDTCPPFCTFQAICRRERGVRQDPDDEEDDE